MHIGAVSQGMMPQTKLLDNVAHIVIADQLRCKHSRNADDYATERVVLVQDVSALRNIFVFIPM